MGSVLIESDRHRAGFDGLVDMSLRSPDSAEMMTYFSRTSAIYGAELSAAVLTMLGDRDILFTRSGILTINNDALCALILGASIDDRAVELIAV